MLKGSTENSFFSLALSQFNLEGRNTHFNPCLIVKIYEVPYAVQRELSFIFLIVITE